MRVPFGMRRAPTRSATSLRSQAITTGAMLCQHGIVGLKLTAGTLAAATTALAIMNYQDGKPAAAAFEPAQRNRHLSSGVAVHPGRTGGRACGRPVGSARKLSALGANDPLPQSGDPVSNAAAVTPEAAPEGLIKVGGFVAFPAKHSTEQADGMLCSLATHRIGHECRR